MQLEELCIQLGIQQHISALSEFRDDLLRSTAAELQAKDVAKTEAIAAATEPLTAKIAELEAYAAKVAQAESAILGAIQNPDLDDTLTVAAISSAIIEAKKPEPSAIEKRRAELLAELESLDL